MGRRIWAIVWLIPFLAVGGGLLAAGYYADPAATTDDGYPLQTFFYFMGGFFLGLPLLITLILALIGGSQRKKMKTLMETGQPGEATIVSLEDTGVRINDDPRVRLVLDVRVAGYPSYQVRKTMVVPLIRLSQVQVGSTVQVLADPTQPDNPDRVGLLLR